MEIQRAPERQPIFRHSEAGQILVSFLILLPVLIAATLVTTAGILLLRHHMKANYQCRSSVMQAEEVLVQNLNSLLDLNPLARALRLERELAEQEVRLASANPPALALATAHLQSVVSRQLVLAARQRSLIATANSKPAMILYHGSLQWRRNAADTSMLFNAMAPMNLRSTSTRSGALAIKSSPVWSITPDYFTLPDQQNISIMSMSINYTADELLPAWMQEAMPHTNQKIRIQCQSMAMQGEQKWMSKLNGAKPLSKWL